MAAGDSNPTRTLLQTPPGTDNRALALQMFSGLVLEAFKNKTVFYDNTGNIMSLKVLQGSHSAQFPIIGDDINLSTTTGNGVTKGYHTPGTFIAGELVKMSKVSIEVDDILVAAMDVGYADLDIAHFDVLAPFAMKLGRSLAQDCDRKIAITAIKAARTAAVSGIHNGGQLVTREIAGTATGSAAIAAAYQDGTTGSGNFRQDCAALARQFDEDNVPEDGRYLFISPYIRSILRHEVQIFDRDYNDTSIAGNLNTRVIGKLEGFNLIMTNNMPLASVSGYTGYAAKYNLTITENTNPGTPTEGLPAAIALCGAIEGSAGVGMVQASGIRSVIQDDERRNTKFLKSQMMVGFGVLSPWCAGAIEII